MNAKHKLSLMRQKCDDITDLFKDVDKDKFEGFAQLVQQSDSCRRDTEVTNLAVMNNIDAICVCICYLVISIKCYMCMFCNKFCYGSIYHSLNAIYVGIMFFCR